MTLHLSRLRPCGTRRKRFWRSSQLWPIHISPVALFVALPNLHLLFWRATPDAKVVPVIPRKFLARTRPRVEIGSPSPIFSLRSQLYPFAPLPAPILPRVWWTKVALTPQASAWTPSHARAHVPLQTLDPLSHCPLPANASRRNPPPPALALCSFSNAPAYLVRPFTGLFFVHISTSSARAFCSVANTVPSPRGLDQPPAAPALYFKTIAGGRHWKIPRLESRR